MVHTPFPDFPSEYPMSATRDITQPFLTAEEAEQARLHWRHVDSSWGRSIAYGLAHKFAPDEAPLGHHVWPGTFQTAAYRKRRTRNRLARASRRINRRNHR